MKKLNYTLLCPGSQRNLFKAVQCKNSTRLVLTLNKFDQLIGHVGTIVGLYVRPCKMEKIITLIVLSR